MIRILIPAFFLTLSFHSFGTMAPGFDQKTNSDTLESKNYDTKMGADAAATGTDIKDVDIQAQEEIDDKSIHNKKDLQHDTNTIKSNKEP